MFRLPAQPNILGSVLYVALVALAAAATWLVRRAALRVRLLDAPNARSAHARPTPRLGGVAIMGVFVPTAAAAVATGPDARRGLVVIAATAAVALLGLVDDLRPLPARLRLAVHLAAAAAVVASGWRELPAAWASAGGLPTWVVAAASVLWIAWVTNLYNFMDGIDGLAGGQAVIGGGVVAMVAFAAGAPLVGFLAAALAAASLGFLGFNFPRASIFMGDAGSTAIGFFLASTPFLPSSAGRLPVEVVALALALFVLDATVTLLRRALRGERLFQAHRSHFYQRPLAQGVPHHVITLSAYAGMAVVGWAAWAYARSGGAERVASVAAALGTFAALALAATRRAAVSTDPVARPVSEPNPVRVP